ncbi:MAG: anti-virulence regulator CigR family protein [Gemmatimonadales bacterium]|jgi:hypothetical protein
MIRVTVLSILLSAAALTAAPELLAQNGKAKQKEVANQSRQAPGFSSAERQIIVEFFASHTYRAQPLPPGIAKNLARGKPLPPGIAKKQIPADLKARLPGRVGVEISIFGDRIVLLEASGVVVDVLEGIFR